MRSAAIPFSVVSPPTRSTRSFCPETPFILVGTKTDLRDDPATVERLASNQSKPVSTKEGNDMATAVGAKRFTECSALKQNKVKETFESAVRLRL